MRRPLTFLVLIALLAAPGAALAQADARKAFDDGKKAYAQGQFEQARDAFLAASRTDNRNPEVFLWLGRAHYQLGEVQEALSAWQRTLRLAPDEPYAKRMVAALRGEITGIAQRVKVIELLLAEGLPATAHRHCGLLLANKALTDAQRFRALILQARALVEMGKASEALAAAQKVLARPGAPADDATLQLTIARAKVRLGGRYVAEGLALLKKVQADHKQTPAGATAAYELIVFDLGRKTDAAGATALKKWLDAHGAHESAAKARQRLVQVYLALAKRGAAPQRGAKLSAWDASAVAVVADLLKDESRSREALRLAQTLVKQFDGYYGKKGAYAAALDGFTRLAAAALPRNLKMQAMEFVAIYRTEIAMRTLNEQGKAGKLPGGAMPKVLADAVAAREAITKQFPDRPLWAGRAELAERVRQLAGYVPWPPKPAKPTAPLTWAVEIALPVVEADADAKAVAAAVRTVTAVIDECAKHAGAPARGLAVAVSERLIKALSEDNAVWPAAMLKHVDLLGACATGVFADNLRAGKAQANAQLSDVQKQMLAAMARLVARRAAQADAVLKRLAAHLKPWLQHGHYALAVAAYGQLAAALPELKKREAALAAVGVEIERIAAEHRRLLAAGQTVPKQLVHTEILQRLYQLQGDLREGDALLKRVRRLWDTVVKHYKSLDYYDLAEQAIKVRPKGEKDPPTISPAAARYAELQLANLHYEMARRALDRFLEQYGAGDKVAMTPAFRTAISDYTQFAARHAASPLSAQAVSGVFSIAQIFEQHHAYDVAAGVYRDFAAAMQKVPAMAQAPPGQVSTAERAEYAVADTLYAKALHALKQAQADRRPEQAPPAKISAEFSAAVAEYQRFAKARPASALLGRAIARIMSVALAYAKINAWDVADGIYADLLKAGLKLRRPERIEFCRGLCQLGKVMPDHARQVLTALSAGTPTGRVGRTTTVGGLAISGEDLDEAVKEGAKKPPAGPSPAKTTPALPAAEAELKKDASEAGAELDRGDALAMVAIRKQQARRASRIAALRDKAQYVSRAAQGQGKGRGQQAAQQKRSQVRAPVLSEAEIARQAAALDAAYKVFQAVRKNHPRTATAKQARGEIMVMIAHWRGIAQWQRAAELTRRYLADNPTDAELPKLRLAMARDTLSWAAKPVKEEASKQAMLAEVARRFDRARTELGRIVAEFEKEKAVRHEAQWEIANSFLTQARVVSAFSATLARGQFVRAAEELLRLAAKFHDHPKISTIPKMLWDISQELASRGYYEQAIIVWNDLTIQYPTNSLAQQAAMRIAQTYQSKLNRPLKAAETYLELNFARGGSDTGIQNTIFQIGSQLKAQKRWVEALHVLETFVDSFPRHPNAGQALTTVGQIHQANEAWEDAIAAYQRVIDEFPSGTWVRDAKWAIAECTINLSRWRAAAKAYESYLSAYGKNRKKDAHVAEAERRIGVLKDLARFQALVDEKGQRKAFDAQFQIAEILLTKLSNPVKAIIEYRKVPANWQDSHLADDAMFKIGQTYLNIGETGKARSALMAVAQKYPNSPLADDALYMVGKSYEAEAQKLTSVTRARTVALAQEKAQRFAYRQVQDARDELRRRNIDRIAGLRKGGKSKLAELEEARGAAQQSQYALSNTLLFAGQAEQQVEVLTAKQLADRQDKINAALRKAVSAYQQASKVAAADRAGDALLRMATIYAERLKDTDAAMKTYLEIVRQFSGTSVAEDASWRIAQHYERQGRHDKAIDAYKQFLRNYRQSTRAGAAQFAVAENYEHLGKWVEAMDAYTNYINNFKTGPLVQKAKEQINWIKTYRL